MKSWTKSRPPDMLRFIHSFIQSVLGLEGPSCTAGASENGLAEQEITHLAQDICLRAGPLVRKTIGILHRLIYPAPSRTAALPGGRPPSQLW